MKNTIVLILLILTNVIMANPEAVKFRDMAAEDLHNEKYKEAQRSIQSALNIELKKYGAESPEAARSQLLHSRIMFYNGNYTGAVNTAKSALNILGRKYGENSPEAAQAGIVLADLFFKTGEMVKCEATAGKSLAIFDKTKSNDSGKILAAGLLAKIYSLKNQNKQALKYLNSVSGIIKPDSSEKLEWLKAAGAVYAGNRDFAKAVNNAEAAIKLAKKMYGGKSLHCALAEKSLAEVYVAEKKYTEAQKILPDIAQVIIDKVGTNHLLTVEMMILRGNVFMREGKIKHSSILLINATDRLEKMLPESNFITALAMFYSGQLNAAQKSFDAAELELQYAVKAFMRQLGTDNLMVAACCNELSIIALQRKDYKRAVAYAKRMQELYLKLEGTDDPATAAAWRNLGFMYTRANLLDNAAKAYISALKIYGGKNKDEAGAAVICAELSALYGKMENKEKCREYCLKALELVKKSALSAQKKAMIYYLCSFSYYTEGDYTKAYDLVYEAKKVIIKTKGSSHPSVKSYDQVLKMIDSKRH